MPSLLAKRAKRNKNIIFQIIKNYSIILLYLHDIDKSINDVRKDIYRDKTSLVVFISTSFS